MKSLKREPKIGDQILYDVEVLYGDCYVINEIALESILGHGPEHKLASYKWAKPHGDF